MIGAPGATPLSFEPPAASSEILRSHRKIRAEHKTCDVGRPLEGDGGASAALRLDCAEGGPLSLALTVDGPGERVVRMTITPQAASKTGRCPER